MKHGSRRAKGRRLQVEVATILARRFKLTIEASPPTKPGMKKGVRWVAEDEQPDLRVRRMGQPGADVMLVSGRAKEKVTVLQLTGDDAEIRPVWFEVKNVEAWSLDARFWTKGLFPAVMTGAYHQARKRAPSGWRPVAVVGKNYMPPLAVWYGPNEMELNVLEGMGAPMVRSKQWIAVPFDPYFVKGVLK